MTPPPADQLRAFLAMVSSSNPGIGILDTQTSRLYLLAASALADGDHASLAEQSLGITDVDAASHLRGFLIGKDDRSWRILNFSGLNATNNRMESELFEEIRTVLSGALGIAL